uniref:Beta-ketoadipate enol-lactone hydrolase n=2 Tax=Nonomuraea gerenzanensis TaxID=93944 RepID=A0A1M4EDG4_9ACTN|nr:Beta-ketoadipate enol-lactone hydrolase [Nonomuraea gerenzanensis]
MTGTLRLDGCDLRYADSGGTGTPVVFTHGAGADHVMFADQAEHLRARGYRVVVWDLRGHGLSRPAGVPFTAGRALADLRALIGHLALDRPVLAGQSLGGNLGQALVRQDRHLARALIVIDSAWNTGPLSWSERLLLKLATPALLAVPAGRLPRLMADACAVTPAARADARRAFSQLPKKEFVQVWNAAVELITPDPGYRTPVPLCLIRGSHDRTGNIASAMPRWAGAEGVEEIVIPGAGHLCTQDDPRAVSTAIETFLHTLTCQERR